MEAKYFKPNEIKGLLDDMVYKLDRARELFGAPIVITSGYRDPERNEEVGGVKGSSHTKGKAVDIRCADSQLQKRLIWALVVAGFRRVGVYSGHLHCDIEDVRDNKPSPAFWDGGKSK